VEGDDAARPHMRRRGPDHLRRIGLVDQDIPADRQVEGRRIVIGACFGLMEGDTAIAQRRGPVARGGHGFGAAVDADHRAARADQIRRQQRHVAGAAADVEHAHARLEPRLQQQAPGDRLDDRRLQHQAAQLGLGMAEDVGNVVWHLCPLSPRAAGPEPGLRAAAGIPQPGRCWDGRVAAWRQDAERRLPR